MSAPTRPSNALFIGTMIMLMGIIILLAMATGCSSGGGINDITKPPVDTTAKPKLDPYATFFIENITTPAARKLSTRYMLYLDILPDTLVNWGAVSPGEHGCTSMSGYVGVRTVQLLGVADTVTALLDVDGPALALGTLVRPGAIIRRTVAFDPLVSADTSRGHTRQRPVMWRWTISDAGLSFREDSLSGCAFPP